MRKYWKLVTFSIIICLTAVLYLSDLYGPIQKIPTYQINTIAGDESLVENVSLHTYVESIKDDLSYSYVNIYQNKSVKAETQLFYKRIDDRYANLNFMQRIKDYPSFMRMKSVYDHSAETDKYIAYLDYEVRMNWYTYSTLLLDVLNKETGNSKLITIDLHEELDINDSNLESIILVGDKAYIVVSHYRYHYDVDELDNAEVAYDYANEGYDYYLLTVDLLAEKVEQTEMLASFQEEDYWNADYYLTSLLDAKNEDKALISLVKRSYDDHDTGMEQEVIAVRLLDAKGTVSDGMGEKEWKDPEPLMFFDGKILFGEHTDSGTSFRYLDLASGEAILEKSFEGIYFRLNEVEPRKEQVIYFAATNDIDLLDTQLVALTADTLEMVYEGELVTKDKNGADYNLQIMSVDRVKK